MTRVLVFGTFDGLHEGHEAYLAQARTFGDTIVASVPQDTTVALLKGKPPKRSFEDRKQALLSTGLVEEVIASDEEPGTYRSALQSRPDHILLGYDQHELIEDLCRFLEEHHSSIPVSIADPHHPETYKSSLLNV